MKRRSRIFLWLGLAVAVFGTIGFGYYRFKYPFGRSHHCETMLYLALQQYAAEHGGRYPAGEGTAEASLSLLHRTGYLDAHTLGGKSVPTEIVRRRLATDELLTPETCGWHYVEGLRSSDSDKLALFWDKAGLDHNGGRLAGGGHFVWFATGASRQVPASEWEAFLAEQKQLLAARPRE